MLIIVQEALGLPGLSLKIQQWHCFADIHIHGLHRLNCNHFSWAGCRTTCRTCLPGKSARGTSSHCEQNVSVWNYEDSRWTASYLIYCAIQTYCNVNFWSPFDYFVSLFLILLWTINVRLIKSHFTLTSLQKISLFVSAVSRCGVKVAGKLPHAV